MRSKKGIGVFAIAALALALLVSLVVPFAATPVEAHAPLGAGEPAEYELEDIWIYDVDGKPLKISIEDVAEAHGDLCICVACAFRVTQAAISKLWDLEEEYPRQGELLVIYHHPSSGHKDAFEYILSKDCGTLEIPEGTSIQHLTLDNYVYTFTRTDTGDTFETRVKEGVFPQGFFELRYKVVGYDKGWHQDEPTDVERAEFAAKWTQARDNFLTMEAWELFEAIEEEGEEPLPTAAITFTGILALLLLIGGIYSWRGRRR